MKNSFFSSRLDYLLLVLVSISALVFSEVIHVDPEDVETVQRLLAPIPDLVVVQQQVLIKAYRVRRDVNPKHQTKHLKPPIEIEPVPSGPKVTMPGMTPREVATMVAQAVQSVTTRFDKLEPEIFSKGARLQTNTAAWFNAASHKIKVAAKNISRVALIAEEATKFLAQRHKLTREQVTFGLPTADVRGTVLSEQCPLEVDFPCQPRKYRAFNGYCNNVQNPRWGNANTRYLRFLPPDYSDGVSVPRQAGNGEFLPSSRDISLVFHKDVDNPHLHLTAAISLWGELIYHDISHTPQMAGYLGQRLRCCNVNFNEFHPECFPIRISDRDPVYSKSNLRCQEYVRSGTAPRVGCTLGPREQINQVTAFLDASSIYGSSTEESDELRTFRGGFLKMQRGSSSKGLLPADDNVVDCKVTGNLKCFKAGDVRVNEHIEVAVLHTIFAREHNRLSAELGKLNPHWGDETIFQEARRIIGAELQHITYTEFLPIILGQAIMDKYGLDPEPAGHFTGYDININAGIANSVAAAALRFVTSLMPKKLGLYQNGKRITERDMQNTFYAPFDLYTPGIFDQVLEGIAKTHAQNEDEFINDIMTNHMFENTAAPGLDVAAQIIQHGRDHGVPSYVKWRKFCGLSQATSFDELRDVMTADTVKILKTVYKNVSDIDLFTGGLSEIANTGAVVGPTFGCLIGRQFHYLRRGDRYWYENEIPPSSFTKEQLHQIKKTSLARLICDNSDSIKMIQPRIFLFADPFLNADMSCDDGVISKSDLSPWRTASPNFVVPDNLLEESITRARREADDIFEKELSLVGTDKVADPQSPIGTAYSFSRPKRQATLIANISRVLQFASKRFVTNILSNNQKDSETGFQPTNLQELMTVLPNIDVSEIVDIPRVFQCDEQTLPCDHTAKFRTMTGWCNNLQFPELGKSMRAFVRLLAPKYQDGLMAVRSKAISGNPLPSPRLISTNIHGDTSAPHVKYSLMVMQFAQFLDHDITFTPVNRGLGGTILDCGTCESGRSVHPECAPISIPQGDPWYPKIDPETGRQKCIPFTRSLPGQLTLGYREQLNQATAFVDASNTYGSDLCDMRVLRTFVGGRLNTTRHPVRGKDLLPLTNEDKECRSRTGSCFKGGDSRASEQPALTAIHTIYTREHNRVVDQLSSINPHWSDEELFQNSRRIVSAGFQHVAYNEFLPRILGWNAVNLYELKVQTEGYYEGYDATCNPTIFNEFASAAFRFGHSLLKDQFKRLGANYADKNLVVRLRDVFMNPDVIFEAGMVDDLLRGLLATSMETLDQFITKEVTNHLFESKTSKFSGLDLASLNIQRGRDHGIRSYNEYRALCNLKKAKTWEDLSREIAPNLIEKLRLTYETVDDVDLFPGGLSETPLHGGLVGPTFACVIAMQFRQLKKCDRFWYENSNPLIRFTEAQLAEIRKVSISKVLCDNSDDIDQIQRSGFDMPEPFMNPRVPCKNLPSVDLDLWKERVSCTVGIMEIDIGKAERMSPCVMCTCTKEGPICQSLKIANCFQLAQSFSPESILNDHVCKVQCAFAFRAFPQVPVASDSNQLGFS